MTRAKSRPFSLIVTPDDHERLAAAMEKRSRKLATFRAAHPDPADFVIRHQWQPGYRGHYTGDGTYEIPQPYESAVLAAYIAALP